VAASDPLEARRARREARRRQVRRRRLTALGALVAIAAVVAVGVSLLSAGPATPTTPKLAGKRHASAKGRTVAAVHLAQPCAGPYRLERAPILEYHVIAPAPAGAPFPELYVAPALFAQQMAAVHAAGFVAVTLDQLWANWHEHRNLPCGKPVVISFDNGYETQFQYAEPVLARYGWAGDENLQLFGLDWANGGISHHEIRELIHDDGWELDTQGWNHSDMVTQDAAGLRLQIFDARRLLRRWFHVPVNWFCYPSGEYDPTVIDALRAAGFRGSTTEVGGWAGPSDDPYALPRLEVQPTMSPDGLVADVLAMRDDPPPGDSGAH
jgi:peptidoglycan/xylan/chitin deacetylase (PgdA/CDA1 family)